MTREGAGDIAPPLRRCEPDLARRALDAAEQEAIDGDAGEPAHRAREQGRLIEAPRPQPRAVERHRHDQIGIGEQLGSGGREPAPEQRQALMPVADI